MDVFSREEAHQIVLVCVAGGPAGGVTEAECDRVMEWARQTRVDAAILELMLSGQVAIDPTKENFTVRPLAEPLLASDKPHKPVFLNG